MYWMHSCVYALAFILCSTMTKAQFPTGQPTGQPTSAPTSISQHDSPDSFDFSVYYISYLESSVPSVSNFGNAKQIKGAMQADDSAMIMIDLPFAFPFMGVDRPNLFVNSNGGLQLTGKQPCSCGCWKDTYCNFNNAYSGTINGFLTDLDPLSNTMTNNLAPNITYQSNSDTIIFTFSNLPFFVRSTNTRPIATAEMNSFRIILAIDGGIQLAYVLILC